LRFATALIKSLLREQPQRGIAISAIKTRADVLRILLISPRATHDGSLRRSDALNSAKPRTHENTTER
jgi:hypothetical protein